jgi:cellulose synthase/poly-beta-1,6-N-acetylglucosamine synthase-like glycosyltransferase
MEALRGIVERRRARRRSLIRHGHVDLTLVGTTAVITASLIWLQCTQTTPGAVSAAMILLALMPVWANVYKSTFFAKMLFLPEDDAGEHLEQASRREPPAVAFLIVSYHEPFEVCRMTFDCAWNIDHEGKKQIIVVDNSRDTSRFDYHQWKKYVEAHAGRDARIDVKFVYNDQREGLKPGNLDEAQRHLSSAEYVVLLDVDSTLPLNERLLDRAVAQFNADEQLGFLQFHTVATNEHFNPLTQAIAVNQNFLRLSQYARSFGGFALFYGHNAIWRRTALEKTGPWLEHFRGNVMVTEDLLKVVQAYEHGYYGKYLSVKTGEWIPSSLDALEGMWLRWTYGGLQVLRKYFWKILTAPGLLFFERFDLLMFTFFYWTLSLVYPLVLLSVLFLPPAGTSLLTLVTLYIPHGLAMLVMYKHHSRAQPIPLREKLWRLYAGFFLVESFVFVVYLLGMFRFALRVPQGWKSTAKSVEETPSWSTSIRDRGLTVLLGTTMILTIIVAWGARYHFSRVAFFHYFPTLFLAANLVACVFLYGREGRNVENTVLGASIDRLPAPARDREDAELGIGISES